MIEQRPGILQRIKDFLSIPANGANNPDTGYEDVSEHCFISFDGPVYIEPWFL